MTSTSSVIDFGQYSSIENVAAVLISFRLPAPVVTVVNDYCSDEEVFAKVDPTPTLQTNIISKLFHKATEFIYGYLQNDQNLHNALSEGNIKFAIIALKSGARPIITFEQFKSLLTQQQHRSISFIFAQMSFHEDTRKGFVEISQSLTKLPTNLFQKGLEHYLKVNPLCIHEGITLSNFMNEHKCLIDEIKSIESLEKHERKKSCECKEKESSISGYSGCSWRSFDYLEWQEFMERKKFNPDIDPYYIYNPLDD